MTDKTTVALVGIGGYGELYLSALLDEPRGSHCRIVGVVDPQPQNCSRLSDLQGLGVPVHATLDEFYSHASSDLAVLSSPIQLHADHTCTALAHDSNVLVEKPAAAVVADVDRMIEARDQAGRFVAVGFQWSFCRSILELKQDIIAGRFGAPITGRCLTLWPRTESYYSRNHWAGKKQDTDGRWILDSPANNAMAHFLHNLLFLFGDQLDRSATPATVDTRLARANSIETFDTIGAQILLGSGVELLFLASHAIGEDEAREPGFRLEFENATVEFPGENAPITAQFNDGTTHEYESPNASPQSEKLWHCVNATIGATGMPCGLEAARCHTLCVDTIEKSDVDVLEFDDNLIRRNQTDGGLLRWVPGLAATLDRAYVDGTLPDLEGMR